MAKPFMVVVEVTTPPLIFPLGILSLGYPLTRWCNWLPAEWTTRDRFLSISPGDPSFARQAFFRSVCCHRRASLASLPTLPEDNGDIGRRCVDAPPSLGRPALKSVFCSVAPWTPISNHSVVTHVGRSRRLQPSCSSCPCWSGLLISPRSP